MTALHIVPSDSAGGSLVRALRDAGRDDAVLAFRDSLNCGPIDPGDPSQRAAWWAQFYDDPDIWTPLSTFWDRIERAEERLVVWFGRRSASEFAFFLAWADRMGDRPYSILDVTDREFPAMRPNPGSPPTWRAKSASILNADNLRSLLGSERPITAGEVTEARRRWQALKSENAPFRIVTEVGLTSAPIDHFDALLLEQAGHDWRKVAHVVGMTLEQNSEPYYQVGDLMLLVRLVAMVEGGRLEVDGNPWEMQACRVRLVGEEEIPSDPDLGLLASRSIELKEKN